MTKECQFCGTDTEYKIVEEDDYDYFVCVVCGTRDKIRGSDWSSPNRLYGISQPLRENDDEE